MKIARDKWRHFYAGILLGIIVQAGLLWLWPENPTIAGLISLLIVVVISYGFELFSKITGLGHYDFMDAVASVLGGIVGMGASYALFLIWF